MARPRRPRSATLSVRGKALLAAGATAGLCATVIGQPALVGVGAFAALVPLLSLAASRLFRFDLQVRRSLDSHAVSVGEATTVRLELAREGRLPGGTLAVEDRVPYALGPPGRLWLRGLPRYDARVAGGETPAARVSYQIRSDVRGDFEVGPLHVRATDLFGVVEMTRDLHSLNRLVVWPRVVPLPAIGLRRGAGVNGENRPRSTAVGTTEDVSVREYRRGDDLRRVHWRTTARLGELMVRREEEPWQARATVLIDNRACAHAGPPVGSSLEYAVDLVASACAHAQRQGFTVRLLDADGTLITAAPGELRRVLDHLAAIAPSQRGDLSAMSARLERRDSAAVIAVLGATSPADAAVVHPLGSGASSAMAVVLDVGAWDPRGGAGARRPPEATGTLLAQRGWITTTARPQDPIARTWHVWVRGERQVCAGPTEGVSRTSPPSPPGVATGPPTTGRASMSRSADSALPSWLIDRGRGWAMQTLVALLAFLCAACVLVVWTDLTSAPSQVVVPMLVAGVVVLGISAALRLGGCSAGMIALIQLIALVPTSVALIAERFPTPSAFGVAGDRLAAALDVAQQQIPPVSSAGGGIGPILALATIGLIWLIDLIAVELAAAPAIGLPLLAYFSVPLPLIDPSVNWIVAGVVLAIAYLALLVAHDRSRALRGWASAPPVAGGRSVPVGGLTAGLVAIVLALVVALVVPVSDLAVLRPGAREPDSSAVTIDDPTADLQGNLTRGDDVALLTLSPAERDAPKPSYLRIGVLPDFDSSTQTWVSGGGEERALDEGIDTPEGVTSSDPTYEWEASANDAFASRWLPVLDDLIVLEADRQWRYRPATADFPRDEGTVANQTWSFTTAVPELSAEQLNADSAGQTDSAYSAEPEIDPQVAELAEEITADADTDAERAWALQAYFRSTGGFTYDLEASTEGDDSLTEFLFDTRTGYCQHFASAMAVMARELGIPSRVVVGFLEPSAVSGGWEYSAHDLHAWPELYFEDAGWVRFEPTPAQRAEDAPAYSTPSAAQSTTPTPSATTATPSTTPTPTAPSASTEADPADDAADSSADGAGLPWRAILMVLLGAVVVAALLALPTLARRRRRAQHVERGAEGAWEELRAGYLDLRLTWPEDLSPARTVQALRERWRSAAGRVPEEADADLTLVQRAVERERYAPAGATEDAEAVMAAVRRILTARAGDVSVARRWLAPRIPRVFVPTARPERAQRDRRPEASIEVDAPTQKSTSEQGRTPTT